MSVGANMAFVVAHHVSRILVVIWVHHFFAAFQGIEMNLGILARNGVLRLMLLGETSCGLPPQLNQEGLGSQKNMRFTGFGPVNRYCDLGQVRETRLPVSHLVAWRNNRRFHHRYARTFGPCRLHQPDAAVQVGDVPVPVDLLQRVLCNIPANKAPKKPAKPGSADRQHNCVRPTNAAAHISRSGPRPRYRMGCDDNIRIAMIQHRPQVTAIVARHLELQSGGWSCGTLARTCGNRDKRPEKVNFEISFHPD